MQALTMTAKFEAEETDVAWRWAVKKKHTLLGKMEKMEEKGSKIICHIQSLNTSNNFM